MLIAKNYYFMKGSISIYNNTVVICRLDGRVVKVSKRSEYYFLLWPCRKIHGNPSQRFGKQVSQEVSQSFPLFFGKKYFPTIGTPISSLRSIRPIKNMYAAKNTVPISIMKLSDSMNLFNKA